jgi:hypothetical protein
MKNLRMILNILREHRLVCKLRRCEFLRSYLNYLGHNIYFKAIGVEERKVHAIRCWERSKNIVIVPSFLGLRNYYDDLSDLL